MSESSLPQLGQTGRLFPGWPESSLAEVAIDLVQYKDRHQAEGGLLVPFGAALMQRFGEDGSVGIAGTAAYQGLSPARRSRSYVCGSFPSSSLSPVLEPLSGLDLALRLRLRLAALRTHRAHQKELRLALGLGALRLDDLVFVAVDEQGDLKRLHPETLAKTFKRRARRAGVPVIRFHDLRHTWASLALRAGESPKVVQERLGHKSIQITLDIYSHVAPGMQKDAATHVAARVFGAS